MSDMIHERVTRWVLEELDREQMFSTPSPDHQEKILRREIARGLRDAADIWERGVVDLNG